MPNDDTFTPETHPIPNDAVEALALAADAARAAAGAQLWEVDTLPATWYALYGSVQQILQALSDFAKVAIDRVPQGAVLHTLYVDDVGPAIPVEQALGGVTIYTSVARHSIDEAADQWSTAHSYVGRLGVKSDEDAGDER